LGKRRYRRKIEGLEKRIREHQEKIRREREKGNPDEGLIAHWEKEIRAFKEGIRRAKRRLGGER
jgi:peptidoglycan hydrolase CwlO-like protein